MVYGQKFISAIHTFLMEIKLLVKYQLMHRNQNVVLLHTNVDLVHSESMYTEYNNIISHIISCFQSMVTKTIISKYSVILHLSTDNYKDVIDHVYP